jgi:hypothetical protein
MNATCVLRSSGLEVLTAVTRETGEAIVGRRHINQRCVLCCHLQAIGVNYSDISVNKVAEES